MIQADLVSLVIEVEALMSTYLKNHLGRAIQYAGYQMLGQSNPNLEAQIHQLNDAKPLTVSGLMKDNTIYYGQVTPKDRFWIRLTGLSRAVCEALLSYEQSVRSQLSAGNPVLLELDKLPWAIHAITTEDSVWSGNLTYPQLIEFHRENPPPAKVRLEFYTPTTFRTNGINTPLPIAELVFGSILSRWITFTSHHLRDLPRNQLDMFIQHHVLLNEHHIQTDLVRGKQGGKEVGFYGHAMYAIVPRSPYLAKQDPELERILEKDFVWFARTMGLLTDFARFSGVGRKTTMGMGMVFGR